ncbi:MAG: DUF3392 domain-containing protein [Gammaproteobacteria bacterium]|nr:DUF3392 domain-containing protein [Gammaproteobacteria bacterium]
MPYVYEYLNLLDTWLRANLEAIAVAQSATLLVIYGDYVNEVVRIALKPYPFLVRLVAFVFLCAFGFGALGVFAANVYGEVLARLDHRFLTPVVATVFLLLGMAAERGVLARSKPVFAR